MCVCFSLSLHVLSLLRCCSHRLHIETTNMLKRRKKLKKCRFEWVECGDTWYAEQPCNSAGLWREAGWGDLQNAPGDSALHRFGTLCCEVLTCFDLRRFNAFYWVICVVLICLVCLICFTCAMSSSYGFLHPLIPASFTQSWQRTRSMLQKLLSKGFDA